MNQPRLKNQTPCCSDPKRSKPHHVRQYVYTQAFVTETGGLALLWGRKIPNHRCTNSACRATPRQRWNRPAPVGVSRCPAPKDERLKQRGFVQSLPVLCLGNRFLNCTFANVNWPRLPRQEPVFAEEDGIRDHRSARVRPPTFVKEGRAFADWKEHSCKGLA